MLLLVGEREWYQWVSAWHGSLPSLKPAEHNTHLRDATLGCPSCLRYAHHRPCNCTNARDRTADADRAPPGRGLRQPEHPPGLRRRAPAARRLALAGAHDRGARAVARAVAIRVPPEAAAKALWECRPLDLVVRGLGGSSKSQRSFRSFRCCWTGTMLDCRSHLRTNLLDSSERSTPPPSGSRSRAPINQRVVAPTSTQDTSRDVLGSFIQRSGSDVLRSVSSATKSRLPAVESDAQLEDDGFEREQLDLSTCVQLSSPLSFFQVP